MRGIFESVLVPAAMARRHGECITIKELVPVVLAAAVWGKEWVGQTVQAHCDNAAVVEILNGTL